MQSFFTFNTETETEKEILMGQIDAFNKLPAGSTNACHIMANIFEFLATRGHSLFDVQDFRIQKELIVTAVRMVNTINSKINRDKREHNIAYSAIIKTIRQMVKMIQTDKPKVVEAHSEILQQLKNALTQYDATNQGSITIAGMRRSARTIQAY